MKTVAVLCLLLVAVALSEGQDKYTTKYDNIDLDEILNSKRLLNNYVNCLLEKGTCTPDGKELKDNINDALQNDCAKCSEKQREGSKKVLKHLLDNEPENFKELEAKYDPNGIYRKKYEKEVRASP